MVHRFGSAPKIADSKSAEILVSPPVNKLVLVDRFALTHYEGLSLTPLLIGLYEHKISEDLSSSKTPYSYASIRIMRKSALPFALLLRIVCRRMYIKTGTVNWICTNTISRMTVLQTVELTNAQQRY